MLYAEFLIMLIDLGFRIILLEREHILNTVVMLNEIVDATNKKDELGILFKCDMEKAIMWFEFPNLSPIMNV